MLLKRKLSALLGAIVLTAALTACGSGGETNDGNSGSGSPTAEPTNDDGDSGEEQEHGGGADDSSGE